MWTWFSLRSKNFCLEIVQLYLQKFEYVLEVLTKYIRCSNQMVCQLSELQTKQVSFFPNDSSLQQILSGQGIFAAPKESD